MELKEKNNMLKKIGDRIREIRKTNLMEIKQIAAKLKITPQAYGNIENGKTDLSVTKLIEISVILNVSLNSILADGVSNNYNYYAENNSGGVQVQNQNFKELNTIDERALAMLKEQLQHLQKANELLIALIK